MTVNFYQDKLT